MIKKTLSVEKIVNNLGILIAGILFLVSLPFLYIIFVHLLPYKIYVYNVRQIVENVPAIEIEQAMCFGLNEPVHFQVNTEQGPLRFSIVLDGSNNQPFIRSFSMDKDYDIVLRGIDEYSIATYSNSSNDPYLTHSLRSPVFSKFGIETVEDLVNSYPELVEELEQWPSSSEEGVYMQNGEQITITDSPLKYYICTDGTQTGEDCEYRYYYTRVYPLDLEK